MNTALCVYVHKTAFFFYFSVSNNDVALKGSLRVCLLLKDEAISERSHTSSSQYLIHFSYYREEDYESQCAANDSSPYTLSRLMSSLRCKLGLQVHGKISVSVSSGYFRKQDTCLASWSLDVCVHLKRLTAVQSRWMSAHCSNVSQG